MITLAVFLLWTLPIGVMSDYGVIGNNIGIFALAIVPFIVAALLDLIIQA